MSTLVFRDLTSRRLAGRHSVSKKDIFFMFSPDDGSVSTKCELLRRFTTQSSVVGLVARVRTHSGVVTFVYLG